MDRKLRESTFFTKFSGIYFLHFFRYFLQCRSNVSHVFDIISSRNYLKNVTNIWKATVFLTEGR